jgi:LysM repeat protein
MKGLVLYVSILLLGLSGVGCVPPGGSGQNEESDPDFRVGMNRKNSGNYARAIESFERALHRNPQSASAHFELGLLYYQNVTNYASAIYHFDRVDRLQPGFSRIDLVRELIKNCKQELVRDAMGGFNVQMQREMERLERALQENAQLRQEVVQLRAQLGQREPAAASRVDPVVGGGGALKPTEPVGGAVPRLATSLEPARRATATGSATVYSVKPGDTLYSIGRRYGLSEVALRAANPGVVPSRLSVGQVLRIPAR